MQEKIPENHENLNAKYLSHLNSSEFKVLTELGKTNLVSFW